MRTRSDVTAIDPPPHNTIPPRQSGGRFRSPATETSTCDRKFQSHRLFGRLRPKLHPPPGGVGNSGGGTRASGWLDGPVRRSRQGPSRRRRDVRRRRPPVRPHQRRPCPQGEPHHGAVPSPTPCNRWRGPPSSTWPPAPGPAVAPHRSGRHRAVHRLLPSECCVRAGAATPPSSSSRATACACRSGTTRSTPPRSRSGCATSPTRRLACADGPRDPTRRHAAGLRVLDAHLGPVSHHLPRYLMRALPEIADRTSSNPDAYVYLAESIRAWPDQNGLAQSSHGPDGRTSGTGI